MKAASMSVELIRDFVRGETDWDVLSSFGVVVRLDGSSLHLEELPDLPVYEATANDVAVGFLARWARGSSLQDWARVLLGTGTVDLSALEDHPQGDVLLETIWAGAEGSEVSEEILETVRRLSRQG